MAAVRVQTRLPLDDLYSVMRDAIPPVSRSTLHRALQRHGVSHPPHHPPPDKVKRFKACEIGYLHLDIGEL